MCSLRGSRTRASQSFEACEISGRTGGYAIGRPPLQGIGVPLHDIVTVRSKFFSKLQKVAVEETQRGKTMKDVAEHLLREATRQREHAIRLGRDAERTEEEAGRLRDDALKSSMYAKNLELAAKRLSEEFMVANQSEQAA